MATVNPTQVWVSKRVSRTTWAALLNGDTGLQQSGARLSDKSIQVFGTFGVGANCNIEGSNDGGVTWAVLNDPQGNPLAFTTAGGAKIEQILETPERIRPNVTAGDGTTSLTVVLLETSTA